MKRKVRKEGKKRKEKEAKERWMICMRERRRAIEREVDRISCFFWACLMGDGCIRIVFVPVFFFFLSSSR
jgi:hypothetical protein